MKKIPVTYIDTSSSKSDSRASYVAHTANPIAETLTRFHEQVGEAVRHAPFVEPDDLTERLKRKQDARIPDDEEIDEYFYE